MSDYRAASVLEHRGGETLAQLETARGLTPDGLVDHPRFFSGIVARPDVVAAGVLAVADVAATTYFDLSAVLRSLDPVITASGDRLRFESFSTCNGVHARFDLLSEGIDSGEVRFGTTNIDVNAPLRTGLAAVGRTDLLHVDVGADAASFATLDETHVERKVDLPDRWVRGFAETPGLAAGMEQVFEVSGPEAMRFLAALPSSAPGPIVHVARTTRGLQIAPPSRGGVVLAGTARLRAARRVMRLIRRMRVYQHPSGASGWVLDLDGGTVTLLVSAAPYRGFSGEGGLLASLADASADDAARLLEHLAWQPVIDPAQLAGDTGLPLQRVDRALAVLAVSGKVGFDLGTGAWFHRELPVDDDRVTKDNPRLVRARELVAEGLVTPDQGRWRVGDGAHQHWVTPESERWTCTCRWEARYRGWRGPCAHVLAAQIFSR